MKLTINIVEAAAELAEHRVQEHFEQHNKGKSKEEIEKLIWEASDAVGGKSYTDEAQELFNTHYDHYFDVIESSKTK